VVVSRRLSTWLRDGEWVKQRQNADELAELFIGRSHMKRNRVIKRQVGQSQTAWYGAVTCQEQAVLHCFRCFSKLVM
jgi:hypothetical protein